METQATPYGIDADHRETLEACCRKCGAMKPLARFRRNSTARSGRDSVCDPCCGRKGHGYYANGGPTPEYQALVSLIARCEDQKNKRYKDYGGRGVTVCERWRNSPQAFLADVGQRPSPKHSLDRYPNVNGNYEPGNVRWATSKEQNRNMRTNRLVTAFGETLCLAEWAERYGVNRWTLDRRIVRRGMDPELALTMPLGERSRVSGRWSLEVA